MRGLVLISPSLRRYWSCAIFSAPQMFMNNVHRTVLEVGLEEEEEEGGGEGEGQMNYM